MDIWVQHFRVAWHALRANMLRTALTALSVSLGAGAIALMVSLSKSGVATITQGIDKVGGRHMILVVPKQPPQTQAQIYDKGLTSEDARQLRERVPGLADVAFVTSVKNQLITGEGKRTSVDVGVGPAAVRFIGSQIEFGENIPPDSEKTTARVCVITHIAASELFGDPKNAVGKSIVLWGHRYRIIGVMAKTMDMGFRIGGMSKQRTVVLPSSVMIKDEGVIDSGMIVLTGTVGMSHEHQLRVADAILGPRHLGMEDYEFIDFERMIVKFEKIFSGLRLLTGAIAAISLIIAGAGIMNVLLASIKQRVREIGMRRAIGASQADIRAQFLTESIVLAGMGGTIGAVAGLAGALVIGLVASHFIPHWQTRISIEAALVAVVVASVSGFLFGLTPSRRAARMEVVACLRGDA